MGETAAAIDRFGEFELLKRLGAGAQAEVFLAAAGDGRLVALKVMLEHLTLRSESRDAFKREARTSSLLKHPNLVEIYDVGEHDGRPWISMELVRGWSLSALQRKLRAAGTRLDQDEAAELIRQAALGLHCAHDLKAEGGGTLGLVHRDVSPQNIMVSESGIAKVVDFGLVKATALSETVTATLKGKLRYMPPEQLKSQPLDRRCDVFALGAVLWELACGVQLYPGQNEAEVFQQALYMPQPHPDEVAKGLSRGLVEVLIRATAREPDKRMASAKELAEALAPLSSPNAREKLGERVAKLFERLPRTVEEARGDDEHSGPTLSGVPAVGLTSTSASMSGAAKGRRPAAKPSYLAPGPVPQELPADFRERQTDQVVSPYSQQQQSPRATAADRPTPSVTGAMEQPTVPFVPGEKPGPPVREPATDAGVSGVITSVDAFSSPSLPSLGPIVDPASAANAPASGQTLTGFEDEQTMGSIITPPSRKVIAITVVASIGIVLLGAVIGFLLRQPDADEQPPYVAVAREPAPPPERDAAPAPVAAAPPAPAAPSPVEGPPVPAARGSHGKKQGRMGRVEIETNVPAVVRERNVELGATPFSKSFSPGRHRLSVATPDGTASTELELYVRAGDTVRRTVKLRPR